jgi:hypothetical protein
MARYARRRGEIVAKLPLLTVPGRLCSHRLYAPQIEVLA